MKEVLFNKYLLSAYDLPGSVKCSTCLFNPHQDSGKWVYFAAEEKLSSNNSLKVKYLLVHLPATLLSSAFSSYTYD